MAALDKPAVVLDCGTGFLKMGLAGDQHPRFVEPTVIAYHGAGTSTSGLRGGGKAAAAADPLADLDYSIGSAALANAAGSALTYPMRGGVISDFDSWEKIMHAAIYKYLRVFPEDHAFILTEPPLNSPENREYTAEIMFETFDVPALHIGVQAVLALYASWAAAERQQQQERGGLLTGVVVDSGDGCTHVIPVVDGFVIGSSIRSVPLAGRDVTQHVQQLLRERGSAVPPDQSLEAARRIKEQFCYVCADPGRELDKLAADPAKFTRRFEGVGRTGTPFSVDVLRERFLGPELFFQPQLYAGGHSDWRTPLPEVIDRCVQSCPIDCRRGLYSNITLSGGTTMLKHFGARIQRDLKHAVDGRTAGGVEVNVVSHPMQRYAVWFGGSLLGCSAGFNDIVVTREQYQESGPGIVRGNCVYREW